jgi:hypothetical protein
MGTTTVGKKKSECSFKNLDASNKGGESFFL